MKAPNYHEALKLIRNKLEKRRGYAGRVVSELYPTAQTSKERAKRMREVYNVAWGRIKNPDILKALIKEAEEADTQKDPSAELISKYLKSVA